MNIRNRVTRLENQPLAAHVYEIPQVTEDMTEEEAIRMYHESLKNDPYVPSQKVSDMPLMSEEEAVAMYEKSLAETL